MTECPCSRAGDPCSRAGDPWLCRACLRSLDAALRGAPELIAHLRPVVAKTAKAGPTVHAPGTGSRPPVNLEALEAAEALGELVGVARAHGLATMARHEFIVRFKADVEAAVKRVRFILDPPPARAIVGPCTVLECTGRAMAGEGEPEARCDVCGETYTVRALLRSRVLGALEGGAPVRASQAARELSAVGLKVSAKDVENWVRAGRLSPVSEVSEGRRTYRLYSVADVYDAAT